jgi:hypothetical protein
MNGLDVFPVWHFDSLITSEMLAYFLLYTAQFSKIQWKILDSIVAVGIFEYKRYKVLNTYKTQFQNPQAD